MKKSLYLKLSQQETNKKIQLSLVEQYRRIRQKSNLLGWLYFIVAYVSFSSVAIVSFIYRWIMISKDFRFTPHYLQTVIDYNKMSNEQANQYLNTQLKKYQKSRSYGNFSLAQRDAINVTFELLLEKYKLPEPEDNKHLAVMSGLSKIENLSLENNQDISTLGGGISHTQEHLNSISSNVEFVKSAIEPIASYTEQMQQKEKEKEEHIKELKERQEKRKTSAYNREKGKLLTSFEADLSDEQIKILVDYCNKVAVFNRDIDFQDMKNILLCTHQQPFKLSVNKYLSLLFSELSDKKFICKNWKSVAARHACFLSPEDKLLTPNDLYMANLTSGLIDTEKYNLILKCIEKINKL